MSRNQVAPLDPWFARELVCPRDHHDLILDADFLCCDAGHCYPVIDGIPIMLVNEASPTLAEVFERSAASVRDPDSIESPAGNHSAIEPYVQRGIVGTNGNLYASLLGRLPRYPIPEIRLPEARPVACDLLDLGCNWGRWCIAAARKGYRPVGMDPGLESILPARRIATQLGVEARFLVGDARHIPFRDGRFDVVYSYGVLQHFSHDDAKSAIGEAARVVNADGRVLVQMAARYGLLSILQQARRGFRTARGFEVRYWRPSEIRSAFNNLVGPTQLSVDGYLTLNPQPTDLDLLPPRYRSLVRLSERLRTASHRVPAMLQVADSIFASSAKASRTHV